MKRVEDWPERLDEYVESVKDKPFEYTMHDCCAFMAMAVIVITGVDVMKGLRTYTDKQSAYRVIKDYAGGGVAEAVEKAMSDHGFQEVPPLMAQRGDVVLFQTELGDTTGICVGDRITAPGEKGLLFNPLTDIKRAWRTN
ncbi:MAG: hypothetical protein NOU37_09310 [Candidatus Brocadiales bacterium]|nr:hypothetical protein [Candidatus Bathyanammoxibius amoris]